MGGGFFAVNGLFWFSRRHGAVLGFGRVVGTVCWLNCH